MELKTVHWSALIRGKHQESVSVLRANVPAFHPTSADDNKNYPITFTEPV